MKEKLILLALAIAPALGFAQNGSFTINGKIGHAGPKAKIYFDYMSGGNNYEDSSLVTDGTFHFQGNTTDPAAARMIMDYQGISKSHGARYGSTIYFYVAPESIAMESPDSLQNVKIGNSPINDKYQAYLREIGGSMQQIDRMMNNLVAAASPEKQKSPAFMAGLHTKFKELIDRRKAKQLQFAREHPDNYFSIVALSEGSGTQLDIASVQPIFEALNTTIRNSSAGKAFVKRMKAAETTKIGDMAPDFTEKEPDGNRVSLADYRGKYVLLDFWASWCHPCRDENPNVVKAYARYHKKDNFEILGVSLDNERTKGAWIAAIKKDGLTWVNISDLKSWSNEAAILYGVRAIPQNFLIDPNGHIIAKNLRGEALNRKLADIFD